MQDSHERPEGGLSRRDFLRGTGATAAATALTTTGLPQLAEAVGAAGRPVRTAESLVQGENLDAIPAAFVRFDAQQCGFCTPGFVVAMKAVFNANPQPTPAEVERGLQGNICRCGTYEHMRDAIYSLC